MMSKHNEKVIEVLNRYVEMVPPHYAIMLNGEWGGVKTYFIKEKWLSQLTNTDTIKYSIINISLFGMTNIKELENSFIYNTFKVSATTDKTDVITKNLMKDNDLKDKLNKVMSKVANKKIGSLFGGVTGIGMNDLVTIFAKNWLDDDEDGETKVLILDDLERLKIEFEQIFGFISSYLESTGLRVIFISNDARIDEQGYKEKREKIIGETFKIEADIDGAIESFLKETQWLLKPENSYLKK